MRFCLQPSNVRVLHRDGEHGLQGRGELGADPGPDDGTGGAGHRGGGAVLLSVPQAPPAAQEQEA